MTGELYELLSEKGQAAVRKIDQVLIKEAGKNPVEVHSFDMKPIDPLTQEEIDEDDKDALVEDRIPREIGEFIKHDDFNEENMLQETDETRLQYDNLNDIERIFVMDHDFVCISKFRNEEAFGFFFRALESYIDGDWVFAYSNFESCKSKQDPNVKDGPLDYMIRMMEKTKQQPPEEWDA